MLNDVECIILKDQLCIAWEKGSSLFQPCSTLQFPFRYKDAFQQITADRDKFVMVSSLKLPEKERLSLVKSLWDHGLLEIMD